MEKYHIGQEILKEVKAKFPSVAAFAKELCKFSSATYEIFGKTSLDTDLLLKVSKLLDRDFFREFSEKCLNGEVAVVDKQTAESLTVTPSLSQFIYISTLISFIVSYIV